MDVAIRAANMVLAHDLFTAHGARFDASFQGEYSAALLSHGRHIAANLEWHPKRRANHYLANIAGLLFIAAYLPRGAETDCWLAFGVRQLISEVERQFNPEGANFEGSVCYHRLSAEMTVYAAALVLGLDDAKKAALQEYNAGLWRAGPGLPPPPVASYPLPGTTDEDTGESLSPFPAWYFERLERMAEFTMAVTKPDGHVAQIGDNDSGRFFRLVPPYVERRREEVVALYPDLSDGSEIPDPYLDEDHLDHRGLVAAISGLFPRDDFIGFAGLAGTLERALCEQLAAGRKIEGMDGESAALPEQNSAADTPQGTPPEAQEREIEIILPDSDALKDIKMAAYPQFGLYIWRGPRFFLSVRCGRIDERALGAHAHNDHLSIELQVDGTDWIADPGTFLYTPNPQARDSYRSVAAHSGPRVGIEEPSRLDLGLFRLKDKASSVCARFDADGFHGHHAEFSVPVYRTIELGPDRIILRDGIGAKDPTGEPAQERRTARTPEELQALLGPAPPFSPGYGKRHGPR